MKVGKGASRAGRTYRKVLLRSDGEAVAFGQDACGQCAVPARGIMHPGNRVQRYVTAACGYEHTVREAAGQWRGDRRGKGLEGLRVST